jgi:exoribonuclease R
MFIADVIVHRLLAAALNLSKLPSVFHDKAQLNSISDSESDWGLLVHIIMLCNTGE